MGMGRGELTQNKRSTYQVYVAFKKIFSAPPDRFRLSFAFAHALYLPDLHPGRARALEGMC
jgi:hypothetical protein